MAALVVEVINEFTKLRDATDRVIETEKVKLTDKSAQRVAGEAQPKAKRELTDVG